jgi:hypothetical protein
MKLTTLLLIAASVMTLASTTKAEAGRFSISFGNSGYRGNDHGYRSYRSHPRYYGNSRSYNTYRYSGVRVSSHRGYRGYRSHRGYSPVRHAVFQRIEKRFDRGHDRKHRRSHRHH